jgi:hypothetical protein
MILLTARKGNRTITIGVDSTLKLDSSDTVCRAVIVSMN